MPRRLRRLKGADPLPTCLGRRQIARLSCARPQYARESSERQGFAFRGLAVDGQAVCPLPAQPSADFVPGSSSGGWSVLPGAESSDVCQGHSTHAQAGILWHYVL